MWNTLTTPPPLSFHIGGYFCISFGRPFRTKSSRSFADVLFHWSDGEIWRRMVVAVFFVVSVLDGENVFAGLENTGRRCRDA